MQSPAESIRPARGILMLVHRIPFPPDRGDKIRSFHMLKALAKLGPVHLAAFADDDRDLGFADALKPWTESRCIVERRPNKAIAAAQSLVKRTPLSVELFDHPRIRAYVRSKISAGGIDHVFCFSGQMAHFVPPGFGGHFTMDFVDVDSAKFDAYAADAPLWHPMRWVHAREGKLLGRFENRIARRADMSLFVSAAEAALFRTRTGLSDETVQPLGNGVDLDFFNPAANFAPLDAPQHAPQNAPAQSSLIVFTGQMDYRPNIDAVAHFAKDILPIIRARKGDVHFAIVGRSPAQEVQALAKLPGVMVTGGVDDVRSWVAGADIIVAPLLLARGVQNKVLEAMAMARPVVASPAAAEGIDAVPNRDLLVASAPGDFAHAVIRLLEEPEQAAAMGAAARAQVVSRYSWDAQLNMLPQLMGIS
jgi:polysaccharide biosynthesis protein PslH